MDNASEEYTYQIPSLIQMFEFHLGNGNIKEANDKYDEIYKLSDNTELMITLCFSYSNYNHHKEAIEKIDSLYDEFNDIEILFQKTFILEKYNLNDAIRLSKKLLKEKINNELKSKVYINLGNYYSQIDDEKSFDYYLKSFNLNPNITSLKNLSTHHATKGEFFFAEEYIDLGLKIDKNDTDLLFIKSRLCQDQYKNEEAIKYLNRHLMINPTSEVYMLLAGSFGLINHKDEAIFYLLLAENLCNETEFIKLYSLYYALNYITD